jgi:O-antigen/teichoic acid export membrane protein
MRKAFLGTTVLAVLFVLCTFYLRGLWSDLAFLLIGAAAIVWTTYLARQVYRGVPRRRRYLIKLCALAIVVLVALIIFLS